MSERPVECSQCKRPIKVIYKEILDSATTCTEMCLSCPILNEKLHGATGPDKSLLCCSHCETSLESIEVGGPVGCSECYKVFEEFILSDLIALNSIPSSMLQQKERLHIGRSPDLSAAPPLSSKLLALREALTDALKRENYEQAALIRDQIKTLSQEKS
jgi:protein arginine kinase activator